MTGKDELLTAAAEYASAFSRLQSQIGNSQLSEGDNFLTRLEDHNQATLKLQKAAIAWTEAQYG